MKNSNQVTLWIILLIIITLGGYLVYEYSKNKNNSILGSISTKAISFVKGSSNISNANNSNASDTMADSSTPSGPLWDNSTRSSGILAALQATKEANTTKLEISNTDPQYITQYNPHYKGVWNDKSGIIRDKFSGKSYSKDADLEIISKYRNLYHYYVKYKGDYCYFPVSLIIENGFWPTSQSTPTVSKTSTADASEYTAVKAKPQVIEENAAFWGQRKKHQSIWN